MKVTVFFLISVLLAAPLAFGRQNEQREHPNSNAGTEVLTRGPMHEAFAGLVAFDPEPGNVAPEMPPEAIEEIPPRHKPQGANVEWIFGYWAWDEESREFLWVSGIWRNLPPGRQWVPGYWSRARDGAQWTSGYWADAEVSEVEYLPEPPESAEAGPNVQAPSAEHTWLPGSWIWQQNRYAWRPGSWTAASENWVWTPAHYQWTPRGYVFIDGYWDHAVSSRGLLFAPVRVDQNAYSQPGFTYTPSTVIRIGELASELFLRPNDGHYYFGDYYGGTYAKTGFSPSFQFHSGRRGYDPIYSHQQWRHRQDSDWERSVREQYEYRRDHDEARPPRTYSALRQLLGGVLGEQNQRRSFAQPFDEYRTRENHALPFQTLNDEDLRGYGRRGQDINKFRKHRQKWEAEANERGSLGAGRPARVPFPTSPFVGKNGNQLHEDSGPPKLEPFPGIDPQVVPKQRPKHRSP